MSGSENRFAEFKRRSREARAKLDANQQARAAAEEQKVAAIRDQREQPDPAYSEWDAAPPVAPARQREANSGSESRSAAQPKSPSASASEPGTNPDSGPTKE
jgi:hypothetical protein